MSATAKKKITLNATHDYIAYCKCGCGGVVRMLVDDIDNPKWVAKEVADAIRKGLPMERVLHEKLKEMNITYGCKATKKKAKGLFDGEVAK